MKNIKRSASAKPNILEFFTLSHLKFLIMCTKGLSGEGVALISIKLIKRAPCYETVLIHCLILLVGKTYMKSDFSKRLKKVEKLGQRIAERETAAR